jgi:hypothetical protein
MSMLIFLVCLLPCAQLVLGQGKSLTLSTSIVSLWAGMLEMDPDDANTCVELGLELGGEHP